MSKLLTVFTLCSLLSACVIYTPMNVSYSTVVHTESTSSVVTRDAERTITNEVSGRVAPNAHSSKQRSLADCEPFALPRDTKKPKPLTRDDLAGPRTLQALDELVMGKLDEYRIHADSVHSKIEQAHQKWLESCQQKVPR